jgi:hypothetical protein
MDRDKAHERILMGEGALSWGPRRVGSVTYKIHLDPANGQASVVELEPKPPAKDGAFVHLTLEDGRIINCQVLDESPFCAVIGDGPIIERRKHVRDK